jgi:site-specific recombinase XerD
MRERDLFDTPGASPLAAFETAFETWHHQVQDAGALRRSSSRAVYEHMWGGLTHWAVARSIQPEALTAEDLSVYLSSRGHEEDITARYSLRFLRLVERVLDLHCLLHELAPNRAVAQFLERRPDIRHAAAHDREPLPEALSAAQARQLVTHLCDTRAHEASAQRWQDLRNRASVGLQLGAGLTPGGVRSLSLRSVIDSGGRRAGLPWKLRVPADGNGPEHETPIAVWAGQLLKQWMQLRAAQGIAGEMLFPSTRTGKPWGKVAQYTAAREVLVQAGLDHVEGGSFRLRHTFALRQLRRGHSAEDVARWMGLSDASAIERYRRIQAHTVDLD